MQLKPIARRFWGFVSTPFRLVGRVAIPIFIVPLYRLLFVIRKEISKAYRPAKNKLMLLVTNRYTIHAVVAFVVIATGILNLQTNVVRAETFGEKSLMFRLVSQQDTELIEEFAVQIETVDVVPVSYRESVALASSSRGSKSGSTAEAIVPISGSGAIVAPTFADGAESVAPRTVIETYIVQSGDTISTTAVKFGISMNTLMWANDLTSRSVLRPGKELVILPVSGVQHTVSSGDTISKIANKYNTTSDEIMVFNKLASANDLIIGETLIVPGGEIKVVVPVAVAPRPTTSTSTIPTTTSTAKPVVGGSGTMTWPTDLRVITQYFGWSHTGIDVDCHYTNDNYASDSGVVQFSGWKGGYGYAVEINHGNGLVTRYGHHASLYVTAGEQVSKGQALGRCGTTGRSTGTHLHFEVMVNGKFKNPLEYVR